MSMHNSGEEEVELEMRRLCSQCIGEDFLCAEVQRDGESATCSYCQRKGKTISIGELADRIEAALRDHFHCTATEPSALEYAMMSEGGYWERHGDPVADVIGWSAETDEEPAEHVRQVLEERHFDFDLAAMGEENPFDAEAHYAELDPDDAELQEEWSFFEETIISEARFFSRSAENVLDSVFEGVTEHVTQQGQSVITEAGPGREISALYRARVFQSDGRLEKALIRPDREVGPPPPFAATEGRMNARGISVFYGATDPTVALAEVRPPVGSRVVVGRFDLVRPLRLLDIEALRSVYVTGSIFDSDFIRRLQKAKFLERLSRRITIPVMPEDEPFSHLVTQAIADYLASKAEAALDGMIYRSIQQKGEDRNVVLFHKAAKVAPLNLPRGAKVRAHLGSWTDEGFEVDYFVWEDVPSEEAGTPKEEDSFPDLSAFLDLAPPSDQDYRDPALCLDIGNLTVHHVQSVSFVTQPHPVNRHRVEKRDKKS